MEIIYSAKNFVILKYKNINYCYSYGKLIAMESNGKIKKNDNKIETQKNKCHLKQFKEIMKELEQNNTL
jgi:hypothetical protein